MSEDTFHLDLTVDERVELEQVLLDLVYGGVAIVDSYHQSTLFDIITKVENS